MKNIYEGYRNFFKHTLRQRGRNVPGALSTFSRNFKRGWNAASKDRRDYGELDQVAVQRSGNQGRLATLRRRTYDRKDPERQRFSDREKVVGGVRTTTAQQRAKAQRMTQQYKDYLQALKNWQASDPYKRGPKPKNPHGDQVVQQMNKDYPNVQYNSTDIVRGARIALAEACWKGYKAKGMKKKGNRMVPNCVPESEDPRMKTTPASIQQAGGDPKVYKQEKAKKDPQPASKQSKKSSRRATVGRGGGKYRRERIQPPKGHHGPSAPTRQVSVAGDAKGDQKKNFQKGSKEKPLSKKKINRMGVRGQEKKIAAKKKGKTGAANIQLMRDMGVLKTDSRGRVTLAKKKR